MNVRGLRLVPGAGRLLSDEETRTVARAVARPGGCFVAASCPRCLTVKRPLVDTSQDDGAPCARCSDEKDGAARAEREDVG